MLKQKNNNKNCCLIQDISYSNWLNFMISCDSRGTVVGVPIFDLLCHPDLKNFYKQRLVGITFSVDIFFGHLGLLSQYCVIMPPS